MAERYQPPSSFLRAIFNEDVPFGDLDLEGRNLSRLIAMTRDADVANRDWATLFLSQLALDRADVREALARAATDPEPVVRGEAILGIAMLDRDMALPFLQHELRGQIVTIPLLEAAELVADVSLVADLEAFLEPPEDERIEPAIRSAIAACRA